MDTHARARSIEAILFAEGGPVSFKKLCTELSCKESELTSAFDHLSASLSERGISFIQTGTEAALAVAAGQKELIERMVARETDRDIGEAGLEILGILIYRGPSTRSQVDYIRGVNSSSTLRNLLARGLIERSGNPEDAREFLYRPTIECLAHLGVRSKEELPEYATITGELASFESASPSAQSGDIFHGPGDDNSAGDEPGERTSDA